MLLAGLVPACGGNSSETGASAGGPTNGASGARPGAGSGGSSTIGRAGSSNAGAVGVAGGEPQSVGCGTATCDGLVLPFVNLPIAGCCADAKTSHCGLDSSALTMLGATFSEACQPLAQPGVADASCPLSAKVPVQGTGLEIQLPGCCRPDHTCGYQLDKVGGVIQVGLGCVEATPFLDGGTPPTCGDDGVAGAGGAGGDSSVAGAGGDPTVGAGAGDSGSGGTGG